jgi:hypothetical protein
MTADTSLFDDWNQRVKRFTVFDVKLCQAAAMGFILIITKLFPEILSLSIWWFVAFTIVCAVRPVYIWFRPEPGDA